MELADQLHANEVRKDASVGPHLTSISQTLTQSIAVEEPWATLHWNDNTIPLVESVITIGRSPKCTFTLEDNKDPSFALISNRHCKLVWNGLHVLLHDTSANGTTVAGKQLRRGEHVVLDGSRDFQLVGDKSDKYCFRVEMPTFAESQESLTQMEATQLADDCDDIARSPLTPKGPQPWGRLMATGRQALELLDTSYVMGRSGACNIQATKVEKFEDKQDKARKEWAYGMISNRHCRLYRQGVEIYIEDCSGNGTLINRTTLLRRGEKRVLHSGDEICLVNPDVLEKKIRSTTKLEEILQQHAFVFVNCGKTGAVNPRATRRHSIGRSPARSSPRRRRIEEDYDIREVLGNGTVGQVRRAFHRKTGVERAVKIIGGDGRNRCLAQQDPIEVEASILQELQHPYVVQLYDVYSAPGRVAGTNCVYLVMELMKGGDLFDRIVEKEKYTEIESRRTMRRLLAAVHYLHEDCTIVHRDLKPENILLSSRDNCIDVKLTDFGLAKVAQGNDLKTFCGTPLYFAPEVLKRRSTVAGHGRYGKPADMWSLGVVLYILLSGVQPFDDYDPSAGIKFPEEHWKGVSEYAKAMISCLLQVDPKCRLTIKAACEHPWILQNDGDTHTHPLDDPRLVDCDMKTEVSSAVTLHPLPKERSHFQPISARKREKDESSGAKENEGRESIELASPVAMKSPSPESRPPFSPVPLNSDSPSEASPVPCNNTFLRLSPVSAFASPSSTARPSRVSEESSAFISLAPSSAEGSNKRCPDSPDTLGGASHMTKKTKRTAVAS